MCVLTGCRAGPGCPRYCKHCKGHIDHMARWPGAVRAPNEAQPVQAAQRTVASIPDEELLGRVVRSVVRRRPRRQEFAWAAVAEAFALGSTFSAQLCSRFGLDPDTGAELKPAATLEPPR